MVGNDIIDLEEAKQASNWQRERFLDKLFTINEQQIIRQSKDPFITVWRLWSMKEAAYKLYTQISPSRFYNPKGFQCEFMDLVGMVYYENFKCFVTSQVTSKFILSEARLIRHDINSKIFKFKSLNSTEQSEVLKAKLLRFVAKSTNLQEKQLHIKKDKFNIPKLSLGHKNINISLTHHGNYGAFAISLK